MAKSKKTTGDDEAPVKPNYFTKDSIEAAKKKIEERKEEFGFDDNPKIDKPGIYNLSFGTPVIKEKAEGKGFDIIEISGILDAEHAPVTKRFMVYNDTAARILFEYMFNAFAYEIKPIDDADKVAELVCAQLAKFQGQKFQAAVRIKELLYNKDGETKIYEVPEFWYIGPAGGSLKMDISKGHVALSKEDKAKLAQAAEGLVQAKDESKNSTSEAPADNATAEGLPWD